MSYFLYGVLHNLLLELGMWLESSWLTRYTGINLQPCFDSGAQVIPGQDGRAAEALCWVGQRLFSAGLNGEITEYDLENLMPRYSVAAYGGPIWTISSNSQGTLLAVSQHLISNLLTNVS